MTIKSYSAQDTEELGAIVGRQAKSGDIYCISGPLGAGKTVFAQGIAKGLEYEGRVTSPTFTLMNTYEGGRLPLYHFDLYRLEGEADLESVGCEDYFFASGVSLIEWPQRGQDLMPETAVWIEISADLEQNIDYREITIL